MRQGAENSLGENSTLSPKPKQCSSSTRGSQRMGENDVGDTRRKREAERLRKVSQRRMWIELLKIIAATPRSNG